ncbi:MAG: sodium:proton antiporter [Clostridia bacterium]|nr:sodium:proton antiporter [Clostridia bacterium]
MSWWNNIPFFLIWCPLLLSSVTAVLKPRYAKKLALSLPLIGTLASAILLFFTIREGGSFLYSLGEFGAPFGNELRAGQLEALMATAFCFILFLSLLGGYKRLDVHIAEGRQSLYCVMVLLLQAGMMAQVFTNDAFTAYVFIEIMTIAAGALILARTRGRTLFAATKYMIMNLLGSGLFLLGISVLYCLTGELLMESMHQKILVLFATGQYTKPLTLSLTLITIGLAVKSALYPFHAWLPDAYASATPSSSAMLSSLVSKAYIFLYIKFVLRVFGLNVFQSTHIQPVLLVCAAVGIILGSIDAILEKKMRRMIAYSSVAQIGYIYLGIALGTTVGIAAAVFHMIAHALAKALLFIAGDRLIGASDGDATFHELRGAGFRAPVCGAAFTIGACSIVGIPLLGGFASKLYLSSACLSMDRTNAILSLAVLAISTALNAAYFMITVVTLYMKPPHEYNTRLKHPRISTAALAVFSVLLVLLGVFAPQIMRIIEGGVLYFI